MEAGLFALLAAACFGAAMVVVKFGLEHMDSTAGAMVSIPTATLLFWALAPLKVNWSDFASPAIAVFAAVGLFFPALVTLLIFEANQRMGPTVSAAVSATAPFFAVAGAILFLDERLTGPIVAGIIAIVGGVVALTWAGNQQRRQWPKTALLFPLAAAVVRGSAQAGAKFGLAILPVPFTAGLVGYTVSTLTVALALAFRYGVRGLQMRRRGIKWFMLAGVFNGTAVLSLYVALNSGRVVLVSPIAATFPLFALVFSLLLLRRERLGRRVGMGVILVVAGAALLVAAR